ncbi:hypothetical protein AMATHDRAFT_160549 [Amanita thiersii Skay4041]|uniref:Uncharacterized protein n=1 Tax=Amanita thiersii Skay4041 TaxID=703135 RepID=A0A2A9NC74_9AGAR|nr:hypothetical protein AMATHDRAFT_160549 [Amanita thiersii Skay4041]
MSIISKRKLLFARTLAFSSFATNITLQGVLLWTDSPHSYVAYAPHPYLFILFLIGQSTFQALWLTRLFAEDEDQQQPSTKVLSEDEKNDKSLDQKTDPLPAPPAKACTTEIDAAQWAYVPAFIMGNISLTAWCYWWMKEQYNWCQISMFFNTFIQIYAICAQSSPSNQSNQSNSQMTELLAKTSNGLAILYNWKTWGVIDVSHITPTFSDRLQAGVFFLLLTVASGPEPTLGLCLVYDLVAMILGHHEIEEWYATFMYMAAGITLVIIVDQWQNRRNIQVGSATAKRQSKQDFEDRAESNTSASESDH